MTLSRESQSAGASAPRTPSEAVTVPALGPARGPAALAGLLAVGVALGVAELFSGALAGAPSLLIAVGDAVIDNVPGGLERAAIAVLGTYDKPVLLATIIAVCALLGAALGIVSTRRFPAAAATFVAFAAGGTAAALADPRSAPVSTVLVGLAAAVSGLATLRLLVHALVGPSPERVAGGAPTEQPLARTGQPMAPSDPGIPSAEGGAANRRAFLVGSAGAVLVTVLGVLGGRMLAARELVTELRAAVRLPRPVRTAAAAPAGASLDVPGLTPLYVGNDDFYRIDTALRVPQVDPSTWSLSIGGRVDRPFTVTYADLMAMDQVEADVTLSCVSNEVGGDLVGNARWQGVPLAALLERAGVQAGADQVVGRSVDGFTAGFPTAIALDGRNALVAVGMNGEPLPVVHGFPARLVVPGLYGYVSATKWLTSIELATWDEFDGYWIPRGWAKDGPVKTQSRIDVPTGSATVTPGRQAVAGVAWAPTRGIKSVQVRVDDGEWQDADLADALGVDSWRQWVFEWDATPGEHVLAVRATDGTGETQPEERTPVAPDGAAGYHLVSVTVGT